MSGAEFDRHAAGYDGGLDHPIKRLLGDSADQFIAVKARWLLRHEPGLRATNSKGGSLRLLDYGCGAGDLMRVLPGWWADAGPTSLYYPSKKLLPARTRVFVDFIVEQFAQRGFAQRVRGD